MPDNVACPGCGRMLAVAEAYRGREVQCPACQRVFAAGAPTAITAAPPAPLALPDPAAIQSSPPPAPPPPSRRRYADDEEFAPSLSSAAFTPGGALAQAVKILFGLSALLSVVNLFGNYLQYQLVTRLVQGELVPEGELLGNDARQGILGILHIGLYLATVIVFLCWFYRVHANLPALGARDLTYTSGWAVGFWFVPILNLYRPVQIAQEIWRNSDPGRVSGNSTLIGFWWALWIIDNLINQAAFRMGLDARTPEALKAATAVNMVAEVMDIVGALLALAVVTAMDARQTDCAIAAGVAAEPERYGPEE
jgi:hypothetical protein